jgi:hypothetical protein
VFSLVAADNKFERDFAHFLEGRLLPLDEVLKTASRPDGCGAARP